MSDENVLDMTAALSAGMLDFPELVEVTQRTALTELVREAHKRGWDKFSVRVEPPVYDGNDVHYHVTAIRGD